MSHYDETCQVGQKRQPPGYSFRTGEYDHFQLIVVRSGKLFFADARGERELRPGDFVILLPAGSFTLHCRGKGYTGVCLNAFPGDPLCRVGEARVAAADSEMRFLADRIDREITTPGPGSAEVIRGLGRALAWLGIRLADHLPGCRSAADYASYWAGCVRQTLEATIHTGRNARAVLAGLGLSYRQLSRHFVDVFGLSPAAYQAACRLEEAKRLLSDSDLPVTAIAYELHYASSQHFATRFRAATGVSPSRFRQNSQPRR